MSNLITRWMLVPAVLAAVACSKDETTEPDYVQPGASEGDEAAPESTQPAVGASPLDQPGEPAPSEDSMNPPPPQADPADSTGPTSSTATPLKNEEIMHITSNVDAAEIEQAKLAKQKAQNAQVKKFATHMISEHTKSKQKGAKLAKSADLKPEESALGEQLATKAAQTYQSLQAAGKDAFDSEYISAQVTQHQEVLDLLDNQLIPNASDPDLKTQLQATREMVQRHLDEGQKIQQALAAD